MSYLPASHLYHQEPEPRSESTELVSGHASRDESEPRSAKERWRRHRRDNYGHRKRRPDSEPREHAVREHEPREHSEREPRHHEREPREYAEREPRRHDREPREYVEREPRRHEHEPREYADRERPDRVREPREYAGHERRDHAREPREYAGHERRHHEYDREPREYADREPRQFAARAHDYDEREPRQHDSHSRDREEYLSRVDVEPVMIEPRDQDYHVYQWNAFQRQIRERMPVVAEVVERDHDYHVYQWNAFQRLLRERTPAVPEVADYDNHVREWESQRRRVREAIPIAPIVVADCDQHVHEWDAYQRQLRTVQPAMSEVVEYDHHVHQWDAHQRRELERLKREKDGRSRIEIDSPRPTMRPVSMAKEWLTPPRTVALESPRPAARATMVEPPVTRPAETEGRKGVFHKAHSVVTKHVERVKRREEGDPDLLRFAALSLGSLCMGLMIWGAYSALPRVGNSPAPWQEAANPSKLKRVIDALRPVVHVEQKRLTLPPMLPATRPVIADALPVPTFAAPPAPPAFPPMLAKLPEAPILPFETPLTPLPERKEPVVYAHANLGETPMIRTWKNLALLTALSVGPVQPLFAQGQPEKIQQLPAAPAVDYSKQFDALNKAIADLAAKIDGTNAKVDGIKLEEKLGVLKTEINEKITKSKVEVPDYSVDFKLLRAKNEAMEKQIEFLMQNRVAAGSAPAPGQIANVNLDDIKQKLSNIEQAILRLQPAEKRISMAPPSDLGTPLPAPVAATAHIILVNLFSEDLHLWVNQKPYIVKANTTKTVDRVAIGPTVIEVRSPEGVFHKSNPTLVANETFTLTAK